mmetsp:Transcript_50793/g.109834  ORF Transcript_50793/g.109834 Transcript_50793/m.109834 type:complete len:284 (+) Transcript_50793:1038-1889(+)
MSKIGNSYIVKELGSEDHTTLLQIGASLGQHLESGDSLLCPVYLHFKDTESGRLFFVMKNTLGSGPFKVLYDLKGCNDDKMLEEDGHKIPAVHKRIWRMNMWCGRSQWSEEREQYYEGKMKAQHCEIRLSPPEHRQFLAMLERDSDWLVRNNLMDYSLLVSVREPRNIKDEYDWGQNPIRNRLKDGTEVVVNLSIIDYFQRWTMSKKVARIVKIAERNKATVDPKKYGRRFFKRLSARLVAVPALLEDQSSLPRLLASRVAVTSSSEEKDCKETEASDSTRSG